MNRKELIDKAALEYAQTRSENKSIAYLTFKDVAEWADQTMIDKACEWLLNIDYDSLRYRDFGEEFNEELFVNDFCKAMEDNI